jgi:benzoyl-CoA reductase/2-hydroxyglutaryl-CoA dehydratase subunit BcrC/BadD/HgdB
MEKNLVTIITESEFIWMKSAVIDKDGEEALKLLKELIKRLEQQENRGLKSHLG